MIYIQKIYGSCGLNHQIIKKSWDVTPVTYGRTDGKWKIGQYSELNHQKPQFEMNDPRSQFPKCCLKWRFAKIETRKNYPHYNLSKYCPFFHLPVCVYVCHRRGISSFLNNLIVYTMLTIYLWKHIILADPFDRHDQIDPLDPLDNLDHPHHLVQLDHHDYPNTLMDQRIYQKDEYRITIVLVASCEDFTHYFEMTIPASCDVYHSRCYFGVSLILGMGSDQKNGIF